MSTPQLGIWLSTPHLPALEIAVDLGYSFALIDAEHGAIDVVGLDRVLLVARGLGLETVVKVVGPQRPPIQQALDCGADGVVIPHVLDVDHARAVTQFAKFPPAGDRSYAGGRTVGYDGPDDEWFARQDATTGCFPMIEDRRASDDVAAILALDTVDGICMGMSDLSLSRGRGRYRHTEADWTDLTAAAHAADRAGKRWIMPAWTEAEQVRAADLGASHLVVGMEFVALRAGLQTAFLRARAAIDDR